MRAVIHARQSVENQEGIARQVERCIQMIEARDGWTLEGTYEDDNVSAASARGSKTAWSQMLADHKRGLFDVVVAVDVDRLLRSLTDLITLQALGLKVRTVDGEIDLTTSDGEFRATMLAAIASFEVKRKSERQNRANAARIKSELPVPGRRRFGYLGADKATGRIGNTVADKAEADIVREMFESVTRDGDKRETVYGLSKRLNAEGKVPTTGKGIWRPLRVRETLRNKSYAGYTFSGGAYVKSKHVEAIVPLSLWKAANAILDAPGRKQSPGGARRHWLSGLGTCGDCGAQINFMRGSYQCSASASHFVIKRDYLEEHIARACAAAIHTGAELRAGDTAAMLEALAELQRIADEVNYAREDRQAGRITRKLEIDTLDALARERESIEQRLSELRASNAAASIFADVVRRIDPETHRVDLAGEIAERQRIATRLMALDLEQRREVTGALLTFTVDRGRVTRERVKVTHLIAEHLNDGADDAAEAAHWEWIEHEERREQEDLASHSRDTGN
ncbi:recombinase family protein [Pseudoclavibacter helvolus]|uniref:recombinase family protein n=1 Tax=Pseudoclavibacter helvolus TaxID=255205 RepID=UPI0037360DB9